jgi:hypothetical protein
LLDAKIAYQKHGKISIKTFDAKIMFDEIKFQEFIDAAVAKAMAKFMPMPNVANEKKYVYSIKGLADELHMSIVSAQKLKNSGRIPYKQEGRKVMFEIGEVLAAMSVINGRKQKP